MGGTNNYPLSFSGDLVSSIANFMLRPATVSSPTISLPEFYDKIITLCFIVESGTRKIEVISNILLIS